MNQLTKDRVKAPERLRTLYLPIRGELDQVEDVLREELSSSHPFVDRLAKHGFRLGGKRLRPALVLLSAKACGDCKPEHVQLAAAVELIHTATLIHDDVLDEATLRRHLDTINARWDNETSVLLGDFLLTRAICVAGAVDGSFACRTIGEAGQAMCEGELRQIAGRGNYDLSEEDYLGIITGKTASLTACSCKLGSRYADPETSKALTRYGLDLGIAFQIVDDLLDLVGDEHTVGKSLGTDLTKQKATLPLIRLLEVAGHEQRADVIEILSHPDKHHGTALRPWLDRFDAISYAREKAICHARRAADQLESLPESTARESLKGLTEFVVSREQ